MQDISGLDLSQIYDLLAVYTTKHMKMRSIGFFDSEDFLQNKEIIEKLQAEIQLRENKIEPVSDELSDGQTPALA